MKFKLRKNIAWKDPATKVIAVTLDKDDENKTPMIAVLFTSKNFYH